MCSQKLSKTQCLLETSLINLLMTRKLESINTTKQNLEQK